MGIYASKTYLSDLEVALDSSVGLDQLSGSRVLVAGATGLIGSFLVDALGFASAELKLDVSVVACGRSAERLWQRFSDCPWETPEFGEFDVVEGPPLGVSACDYVVHAASNAHPASITADPIGTIRANVDGVLSMLQWGVARGVKRLLYVSSGEVYGQADASAAPFVEAYQGYVDPLAMRSCYPLSKRAAENACVSHARQFGGECAIVRPCHTYGPTATMADSRASSQFIADAAAGRPVELRSAGTQVRSYCHVADAVSGMLTVLTAGEPSHAYNVANPESVTSIAEFARMAAHAGGSRFVQRCNDGRGKDETPIERQVLDATTIMGLGWKPRFALDEGISRAVTATKEALEC